MKIFFVLILLTTLNSSRCFAGNIRDVFGDGLFNVTWGITIEQVKDVHPNGKKEVLGKETYYKLISSKEVLSIKRNKEVINYGFGSNNQLSSVAIYFDSDDYSSLIDAVRENFGLPQKQDSGMSGILKWPIDNDIQVSIIRINTGFSNEIILNIGNVATTKSPDIKSLGF